MGAELRVPKTVWPEASWDQTELLATFPDVKTLGDVIKSTSNLAREQGFVICEVSVNGMNLTEEQEKRFEESGINEICDFKIKTEKVETLLDNSVIGCRDYLTQLMASIEHAASLFRMDDLVAAHKFYQTCIGGAQLFIEMIAHYKIVYQSARGPLPETWAPVETRLLSTLHQILTSYKSKNYILVADILEYDFIDVLVQWQKELIKLEKSGNPSQDSHC